MSTKFYNGEVRTAVLDGYDQCHHCAKNKSLFRGNCENYPHSLIPEDIWNSEKKCPHFKAEEKAK